MLKEKNISTPHSDFKTIVKLQELVVDKASYKENKVVQIAQPQEYIEVMVKEKNPHSYVMTDNIGTKYYLVVGSTKGDIKKSHILSVKKLPTLSDLNKDTKLYWEKHPLMNVSHKADDICFQWKNVFSFKEEKDEAPGLRQPQLGALHAISAHWSTTSDCGTIVMPTGTGKTDVMISTLVYHQCKKVLILVPSNVLRDQLCFKFSTLGCLKSIGAIPQNTPNPRVGIIRSGIKDKETLNAIIEDTNVIIATPNALNNFSDETKKVLVTKCSHLFIDEAHHVTAETWNAIKEMFKEKPILQFTATPFRRDGQPVQGTIIYNYPLGLAQKGGYFKKINLIKLQEFDDIKADEEIANTAVKILKDDLKNKHDHIIMARCQSKERANEIIKIYMKIAPEYNPTVINSEYKKAELKEASRKLNTRECRIVVCVNMLGEGFDLPNLKIAALHDTHKSLAVTLQFIGRFTRTAKLVKDATVIVNIGNPKADKDLEDFYKDTSDWNTLIKERSESKIKKELALHEFIKNFKGGLSKQISLWNLRPSLSTLIYETSCTNWTPKKFKEIFTSQSKYWFSINESEAIIVLVVSKEEDVSWGRYKDIKNHNFELCVAHWSKKHKALFIQCSDYDAFNCSELSRLLCGNTTKIVSGPQVFNIFSKVDRVLARNVGVSTKGNISYTMHFGSDITAGLSKVDMAVSELNNIFGWGYEAGERVAEGCSARKGKIWARGGGPILEWKDWCHKIAEKIFDENIEENQIIKDFLRPKVLEKRYDSIPIIAEWSENILSSDEDNTTIIFGKKEYKIYDVSISIDTFSNTGPILIKIVADTEESKYKLDYKKGKCSYKLVKGNEIKIKRFNHDAVTLNDYMEKDPITIIYADGTFSYNHFHVKTPDLSALFDKNKLLETDWTGIDIKIESMGKENKVNSIQARMAELLKDDYDIIFNDDASGEAADLVCLRQEAGDTVKMHLVHCKFSSGSKVGSRIKDFYEVCGQAQKSIKWKHNGMDYLMDHLKKREETWGNEGKTRFIKGSLKDLIRITRFSRAANKLNFEVSIVQPGFTKKGVTGDIIQLLGSTSDYLLKTSGAEFNVYCSK